LLKAFRQRFQIFPDSRLFANHYSASSRDCTPSGLPPGTRFKFFLFRGCLTRDRSFDRVHFCMNFLVVFLGKDWIQNCSCVLPTTFYLGVEKIFLFLRRSARVAIYFFWIFFSRSSSRLALRELVFEPLCPPQFLFILCPRVRFSFEVLLPNGLLSSLFPAFECVPHLFFFEA